MAKSVPVGSAGDVLIKASAQRFNLSKKALKKAVQQETVRLVAQRIAREQVDSTWQDVNDAMKQQEQQQKRKAAAS